MANVMSIEKRDTILRLLCEGNSIRSITRLMGTNIATVLRQLHWAADHCQAVMDREFVNLHLGHVEVDEMWTFVAKKQARLTIEEKANRRVRTVRQLLRYGLEPSRHGRILPREDGSIPS